ncbi:MAG: tRNA-(ms[2]io[6]A)-hydroxylase [Bacteroidota bacterium]
MKYSLDLACDSSQEWVDTVMDDFDSFLQDHADCERKASSMAMSFVAKYPDRLEIIPHMIETAVEELEHFQDVYKLMETRGVPLTKEMKQDLYIKDLIKLARTGREERFIDRMLIASVVECRGAERFRMVEEALPEEEAETKRFYKRLWTSEAKHGNIFVKLLFHYYDEVSIYKRLKELIAAEAEILQGLPLRAALH